MLEYVKTYTKSKVVNCNGYFTNPPDFVCETACCTCAIVNNVLMPFGRSYNCQSLSQMIQVWATKEYDSEEGQSFEYGVYNSSFYPSYSIKISNDMKSSCCSSNYLEKHISSIITLGSLHENHNYPGYFGQDLGFVFTGDFTETTNFQYVEDCFSAEIEMDDSDCDMGRVPEYFKSILGYVPDINGIELKINPGYGTSDNAQVTIEISAKTTNRKAYSYVPPASSMVLNFEISSEGEYFIRGDKKVGFNIVDDNCTMLARPKSLQQPLIYDFKAYPLNGTVLHNTTVYSSDCTYDNICIVENWPIYRDTQSGDLMGGPKTYASPSVVFNFYRNLETKILYMYADISLKGVFYQSEILPIDLQNNANLFKNLKFYPTQGLSKDQIAGTVRLI